MPGCPAVDVAPATTPPPDGSDPAAPPPGGSRAWGRLSFGLALLAVLAYACGAVLLVLPVRTPQVQDCGAPGAYLYEGRLDVVPDREGRVLDGEGDVVELPPAVADAARDKPCQERVAARAVPAAGLVGGATLVGIVAFALELFVVRPRRRRALAGPPSASVTGRPDWPA